MFAGGAAKSQSFGRHYAAVAQKLGVGFLDFGTVIESSAVDGIHFDPPAHKALSDAVTKAVRSL